MMTIRHRVAQLEQQRNTRMPPIITISTDRSMPFAQGYDAEGVFHFTIHIDRQDEATEGSALGEPEFRP